jgi:hypothetical protein
VPSLTQSIVLQDAVVQRHDQKHSPSILRRVASEIISFFTRRERGGRRRVSSVSPHSTRLPSLKKGLFHLVTHSRLAKYHTLHLFLLESGDVFYGAPNTFELYTCTLQEKGPIHELPSAKKKQLFETTKTAGQSFFRRMLLPVST